MESDISHEPMNIDTIKSTKSRIEDLPLDERIKRAKEFKPFEGIEAGWLIDAKDTVDNWCVATVLKTDSYEAKVNFDGWSSRYDEVIELL
jgi:hypothetical protein